MGVPMPDIIARVVSAAGCPLHAVSHFPIITASREIDDEKDILYPVRLGSPDDDLV